MRVTYWDHSGFSIEADDLVILVDYIGGGFEKSAKPVLALVSHAHGDHRRPEAIAFADQAIDCPAAGMTLDAMGARIRTFGSTDEGVSFLIELDGKRIFHAGDFNLWHWNIENDTEWTAQARADFEKILRTISGERLDIAMFPVDPRIGEPHDEGARIFNERLRPGILIPMHWWGKREAALAFAEKYNNVRALTRSGEHIDI